MLNKMELGVGAFGLGAGAAATFGTISNPVGWGIGLGVGIYGGARLLGDVIGDYNPGGNGVGEFFTKEQKV